MPTAFKPEEEDEKRRRRGIRGSRLGEMNKRVMFVLGFVACVLCAVLLFPVEDALPGPQPHSLPDAPPPAAGRSQPPQPDMSAAAGRFMYFAFGSNLLKERLQLANPSAVYCSTGRLKDFKLNFGLWEEHVENLWHGGVATIESCSGAEVWGVIWTLSNDNLQSLDIQEGVDLGHYSPLEVLVETDDGPKRCRTYQMNNFHACPPSPQYKQVVCLGAEQNGLPVDYLKKLQDIPANNYSGPSILDQIKADTIQKFKQSSPSNLCSFSESEIAK